MKKILALLLSAVLLLSTGVYASAEEAAPADHSHSLSDAYIMVAGRIIDLSDISIQLDVSEEGQADACRLRVQDQGETICELSLTMADGLLLMHMESETLGSKDFALDPVTVLARTMQNGIDGLIEILESFDPTTAAQDIVDSILHGSPDDQTETQVERDDAGSDWPAEGIVIPQIAVDGDIAALLEGCVSEPETVHMGGVDYAPNGTAVETPEGDYAMTTLTIDLDTVCEMLDMITVGGQPSGLGEALREAGTAFSVEGAFYEGETARMGQVTCRNSDGETSIVSTTTYHKLITETGTSTVLAISVAPEDDSATIPSMMIGFTIKNEKYDGEAFGPDTANMDDPIMLSDMDMDQAIQVFMEALGTALGDAMTPVMTLVMGPEATGSDMGG